MTPLGVIISNTCFRHHNLCKKCVEEAITTFQKIQMIVIGARIYKYRLYNIGKRNVLTESGGVVKNRYIPTSHLPLHSYISGWLYLLQEDQAVSTVPGSKRTICMDDDFSLAWSLLTVVYFVAIIVHHITRCY